MTGGLSGWPEWKFAPQGQCAWLFRPQAGYSLLELTLVLLVLAVVTGAAMPRLVGVADAGLNVQAEHLRRNIARSQLMASSRGLRLRLATSGSTYSVSCIAPASCAGNAVLDPETGEPFVTGLENGALFVTAGILDFDGLGRPVDGSGLLASATTITLTRGSHAARVEVLPLTGLAQMVRP